MQSNKYTVAFNDLASAVREERKAHGLTQSELAEHAGCGLTFVHQLENGKKTLRIDKVLNVLEVLGLQFQLVRGKNLIELKIRNE